MKKRVKITASLLIGALLLGAAACGTEKTTAFASPIELTVWTYYNGDQLESFNKLVDQFNETTGREKGIRVESASQGSMSDLETNVMDAAQGKVGAAAMPNIFSAYADTAYALDQMGMLVDLSHCNVGHEELHRRTDALAAEMKMQINVTRQEVFDAMHTI